jgi:hypothetical protein
MPRRLLAFAILVAAAVAVFWFGLGMHRGLLLSEDIRSRIWPWAPSHDATTIAAPALSDPLWQFVPWLELARREIRAGRLPLWNPYQDGGVPLLGNSVSALGSPIVWPALAFGVAGGWNLTLLLRLLVAFGGGLLWLRDAGRSRGAALLGAAVFALSGPFIAWLEHPHTLAAAPLPLLLYFIARLCRRHTRAAFAGTAVATYLVLAGGHPETSLLAAILAAAVAVRVAGGVRKAAPAFLAALLGAGLAAPLLLPFTEYFLLSEARLSIGRSAFTLPLSDLARFVRPVVPGSNVIEAAAAVSIASLLLAAASLAGLRRDRDVRFWWAAVGVMLAVTYANPLSRLLALHTPVYWTRTLILLVLALAFLAAAGADILRDALRRRGWRALARALAPGAALLATGELLWRAQGVHGLTRPEDLARTTPLLEHLAAAPGVFRVLPLHTFLPPESATSAGLEDLRGYDALAPRGWRLRRREVGRFAATPTVTDVIEPWDLTPGGAGLDFWNVEYLVLHPQFERPVEMLAARKGLELQEVYSGPDGRILRNARVLPRARLSGPGRVVIGERTPSAWSLAVEADAPSRLTLANPWFPGWVARVDGSPWPLRAAPGDPIEIDVPAGRHAVEVVYRPGSFRAGLAIAAAAALTLLMLSLRRTSRTA